MLRDDGPIEICRLLVADASAHRALMLDGYRLHPEAFTATVDERGPLPIAWWEARIDADFVVGAWRLDANGAQRLVGAAGLAPEKRPKTRHKATLFGMYVDAAYSRRGIGGRLVVAILDRAAADPALRVVQLTVSEGNDAARALYERCGFVAFGVEPLAMKHDDGFIAKVHLSLDLAARPPNPPAAAVSVERTSGHLRGIGR